MNMTLYLSLGLEARDITFSPKNLIVMVYQTSSPQNAHATIIQILHEIRTQNENMAIPVVTVKVGD
jgi:hypothetical protein